MKENWKTSKIKDVAEVVGGSTPKTNVAEYWGEGHFWVAPAELNGSKYIDKTERTITDAAIKATHLTLLPVGAVLLSSRAPIGKVSITRVPMYCNQGFKNIVCGPELYNEFVYYFLCHNKEYLNSLGTGATFKEISKKVVESIDISYPSFKEQESIVKELDLLSGIIEKKKQQLKELDNLAQSIFYEMFGDPNCSEYDSYPLSALTQSKLSYGTGASSKPYDGAIRYIRITDIQDDGCLNDDVVSPCDYGEAHLLKQGDILFARTGATVGKTYLCKESDNGSVYAGYLIRFVPDTSRISPVYVYFFTKSSYYKRYIEQNAVAVAQPNVNAQKYGALLIPVPPLSLQQSFAQKIEAIEKQKGLIKQSIKETETLFNSRMDYYFN